MGDARMGPYFFGGLLSSAGVWIHNIVSAIVVFEATGSARLVGLVSVLQFAPTLLFGVALGGLADRVDRRWLMIGGQTLAGGAAATLAVVMWSSPPRAGPVLLAAAVIGVGNAVNGATVQALLPSLVPRVDLDGALVLSTLTFNLARAFGPAVGAAALVIGGAGPAFAFNAGSYLLLAAILILIRPLGPTRASKDDDRSLAGGLRFVRRDPVVRNLLLCAGVAGLAVDPVVTLSPSLADAVGGGDTLPGLLTSAFGIGSLLTVGFITRVKRRFGLRRVAAAAFVALGGGMVCVGLATTEVWLIASMALAGTGFLANSTSLTGMLQRMVPNHLLGRVMALWSVAFMGSRPAGALINGTVADLVGPRPAAALVGVVTLLLPIALLRRVPAFTDEP